MEQDHRAVKQRYYPMRGFGSFASAARFCSAFDELRQYFRWRRGRGDSMPLAEQRRLFAARWRSLLSEMLRREAHRSRREPQLRFRSGALRFDAAPVVSPSSAASCEGRPAWSW